MQQLSGQTKALLEQLTSFPGGFFQRRSVIAQRVQLIDQIAARKELAAVVPLLDCLFDRSRAVAASTSDAIHLLLETATAEDLLALDQHLRGNAHVHRSAYWRGLQPRSIYHLPRTERSRIAVLGLTSFHRNGHVREAAVRWLTRIGNGDETPYLLIRLNDWVDSVRRAARTGVENRLQQGPFDPFLRHLFLVLRLTECGRDDHAKVVQLVLRQLIRPEHHLYLTEIIQHGKRHVARQCFQLAIVCSCPFCLTVRINFCLWLMPALDTMTRVEHGSETAMNTAAQ